MRLEVWVWGAQRALLRGWCVPAATRTADTGAGAKGPLQGHVAELGV